MKTSHGAAVLAVEELWTDPAGREALATAAEALSAHPIADQLDAAARHVYAGMLDCGRAGLFDGIARGTDFDHMPGWLRLGIADALVGFLDGTARTCLHNPSPRRPAPVAAAVWRPGVITCGAAECRDLLLLPRGSEKDRTCDACGRVCPAIGADMVRPGVVACGPLMVMFGTCPGCDWHRSTEEATP